MQAGHPCAARARAGRSLPAAGRDARGHSRLLLTGWWFKFVARHARRAEPGIRAAAAAGARHALGRGRTHEIPLRTRGRNHVARETRRAAVQAPAPDGEERLRQRAAAPQAHAQDRLRARRPQVARRPVAAAFHREGRPARPLSFRHVRAAAGEARAAARLQRHHRQADRGRLHPEGPRYLGGPDGALHGLRRRAARRRGAQRLRLRPVHRRPGRALRRRAPRRHRGAHVRRLDRAPDRADQGFRRARAVRHALLRAGHRGSRGKGWRRPARARS